MTNIHLLPLLHVVLAVISMQLLLPCRSMATHDTVIVTAEDIEKMQAHSMADILNTVPGLSAGSSSVSIHGNYKVKVFLDGRPLNDPTSSHGGIRWDLVSPSDIEKIEILRGKGGVRYGQDASGGVILITSKSSKSLSGNIKTFGGNQGRYFVNSSLQWTEGKVFSSIRGGYDRSNGYQVNNDKEKYQAGATFGYSFSEQSQLSFSADYSDDDRGYAGYPDYPTPFSRAGNTMQTYSLLGTRRSLKAKSYLNRGEKSNTDRSRDLDNMISVDEAGVELSSAIKHETFGELSYGAGFVRSIAEGTSFEEQEEDTGSLFLIDNYSLENLPLSFTLGVRANFNSAFDDSMNPEAKITYSGDKWKTTLSYTRTNNTPSFYQRYNETATTKPNPALDMEVADNYSLAFSAMPTDEFGGSLTFFYNRLLDRITYTFRPGGNSSYENVGSATYTGGDFSLTWKPVDFFKCKVNYTYIEAKDENTDRDLSAKPRHKGRIDLTYEPVDKLSMIFTGRGNSKAYRDSANTTIITGYFICDYKMEYDFERFNLFMEITNLLDEEYLYVDGLLAPPRTWFAGIQVRI